MEFMKESSWGQRVTEVGGEWRKRFIYHIMPDDGFWATMLSVGSRSRTLDQAEVMLQSFVTKLGRRLDEV